MERAMHTRAHTHTGIYMFKQQTHDKLNKIFEIVKCKHTTNVRRRLQAVL